jgi:hypothetical protein
MVGVSSAKRQNPRRETLLGEQQIVGMVYDFALGDRKFAT